MLWVVRAGEKGEREKLALQNNIIVVRFGNLGDLSAIQDIGHMEQYYKQVNPERKGRRSGNRIRQIWRFLREIKKGDIVAIPRKIPKSQKVVAIGKVTGDYEYKKEYGDNGRHTRSVEWLKNIPRSEFDSNSIKAFNLPPTVYKIERADDHIKTILRQHGIELQ